MMFIKGNSQKVLTILDCSSNKLLRIFEKEGQQTDIEILLSKHLRRNMQWAEHVMFTHPKCNEHIGEKGTIQKS